MAGTLVDLFAGCGGLGYGMERAGFTSIFVNELNEDALSTYVRNSPDGSLVRKPSNQSRNIFDMTGDPETLRQLAEMLRAEAGGDVDIVAGGPPCQGYSEIGHRRSFDLEKHEMPSNHLYVEMAKVVAAVSPKVFIFENVRGLQSSRWTSDGELGEIWRDVRAAFRRVEGRIGSHQHAYLTSWKLVRAKEFGVPQNRPRLILVGVRDDVASSAGYSKDWWLETAPHRVACVPPSPVDLLDDLVDPDWAPGGKTSSYLHPVRTEAQRRMRTRRDHSVMEKGSTLEEQVYSKHSQRVMDRFAALRRGGPLPSDLVTLKFSQRVLPRDWPADGPNITVASLPDDFVHFEQNRSLTVREWARLQGFPDWYEFSGPRTTGGRRRAGDPDLGNWVRALPKYTQIGNAVPVAMAEEIGAALSGRLGLLER